MLRHRIERFSAWLIQHPSRVNWPQDFGKNQAGSGCAAIDFAIQLEREPGLHVPAIESTAIVGLDGFELRVVTAPYFIGTKLEAFRGRGKGDFYAESDLEDIITVLDGRPTVVEEVTDSPSELRRYIGKEVGRLLDSPEFVNALPGHLAGDEISQARVPMVLRTLNSLRGLGPKRSARRRKKNCGERKLPFIGSFRNLEKQFGRVRAARAKAARRAARSRRHLRPLRPLRYG